MVEYLDTIMDSEGVLAFQDETILPKKSHVLGDLGQRCDHPVRGQLIVYQ